MPPVPGGSGWGTTKPTETPKPSNTGGQPPNTSTKPPSPDPWPTGKPNDGSVHPYCFRDEINSGKYKDWSPEEADQLIGLACNLMDTMDPSRGGNIAGGQNGLIAGVSWAKSQSGCPARKAMPLGKSCMNRLNSIMLWCDDGAIDDKYMGGAITDITEYGCVTWYIGTEQTNRMRLLSIEEPKMLEGEALQEFLDMVAQLEPQLPRSDNRTDNTLASSASVTSSRV
jgi:hypothetical protein